MSLEAAIELIEANLKHYHQPVDFSTIIPSELWQPHMPTVTLEHGVFDPVLTHTTPFFITTLHTYWKTRNLDHNARVCDMMTGTGVIAYALHLMGARHITAVDICSNATHTADRIFYDHKDKIQFTELNAYQSNLFDHPGLTSTLFDLITINPPLLPADPENVISQLRQRHNRMPASAIKEVTHAIFDPDYLAFDKFLEQASDHLTKTGTIFTLVTNWVEVYGASEQYPTPEQLFKKYQYKTNVLGSLVREHGETYTIYELRP